MRRLFIMLGNLLSQILALFTSLSADDIRDNWQAHIDDAMAAGRVAAAAKRIELEKELEEASSEQPA